MRYNTMLKALEVKMSFCRQFLISVSENFFSSFLYEKVHKDDPAFAEP
jgi:hypothetical protein